ncbi:unnamed protein product [Sphagnum jensenii]
MWKRFFKCVAMDAQREGERPSIRGELPLRASDRASEASSLCDRPTERPRRAPSASEREREEREGEKQERPFATCR